MAEARARLTGYPQPIVRRFETLLMAAPVAAIVYEDHNYWIDQRLFYHVRRVILEFGSRPAQAGKLQPGDVLITIFTEPPWTPLFATASAIVNDSCGVLSYSTLVAREYRIPAVVGTGHATSTFHDGQLLEVDGNSGTVRVVVDEQGYEHALVG